MKLASLKGGRDGRLMVVSRDLTRCADASGVAPTMQAAIDDWVVIAPKLRGIAEALEIGRTAGAPFDQAQCAPRLPRARSVAPASPFATPMALWCRARGAELPAS